MSIQAELYILGEGRMDWESYLLPDMQGLFNEISRAEKITNLNKFIVSVEDAEPQEEEVFDYFAKRGVDEEEVDENYQEFFDRFISETKYGDFFEAEALQACLLEWVDFFNRDSRKKYLTGRNTCEKQEVLDDLNQLLVEVKSAADNHQKLRVEIG